MALANIACLLAEDRQHPQRVLLWDFDLEAPGLHKLHPPSDAFDRGFVDLAFEFALTGNLPDPADYVYKSRLPGIDVLPAGKVGAEYCQKLRKINWLGFFGDDPHDKGDFFGGVIDWINAQEYDYILIDSRTGLNDVAGICTQVLPDLLLIIFRLTDQNLDGIAHVVPTIDSQLKQRQKKDVEILPVASVVLSQSSEALSNRRKRAEKVFKPSKLDYIRFDADLIAEEKLYCRLDVVSKIWPIPPIVDDYKRLCEEIRERNPSDTRTLIGTINQLIESGAYEHSRRLVAQLVKRRPGLRLAWRYLRQLCEQSDEWSFADDLVDGLDDSGNVYACEWRAAKYAADAKSPDDQRLRTARSLLSSVVDTPPQSIRLCHELAELNSVLGDLEDSTDWLKKSLSLDPNNVLFAHRLADVYLRRGRNYFTQAAELLEERSEEASDIFLAYLWTFLGERHKAESAVSRVLSENVGNEFEPFFLAHLKLLEEDVDGAIQIADTALTAKDGRDSARAVANWAEFYLCAERFEKALKLLDSSDCDPKTRRRQSYAGIKALIMYLSPSSKWNEEEVLHEWGSYAWNFRELLFFRERVFRRNDDSYEDRLEVIEKLIRQCALRPSYLSTRFSIFWRRWAHKGRGFLYELGEEIF